MLAKLAEPFVARYVRIIPNDALKSMRAEIYGCFVEQLPPYTGKLIRIVPVHRALFNSDPRLIWGPDDRPTVYLEEQRIKNPLNALPKRFKA